MGLSRNQQGRINKCGSCSEKCVGPPPPYTVESRIESKKVHPFNMDKRPTTVLFNDNVCQLKIKDRKIQAVLIAWQWPQSAKTQSVDIVDTLGEK